MPQHWHSGSQPVPHETVLLNGEVIHSCPAGDPTRSLSLDALAITFATRFEESGQIIDLNKGVRLFEVVLSLSPSGHITRPSSLYKLASALGTRFSHSGQLPDFEAAETYFEEALTLFPPTHPNFSYSLFNFANALSKRFEVSKELPFLDRAITSHRSALACRPPGHPRRARSLHNLGYNLNERFIYLGDLTDLDEAISLNKQALALRPPGHPDRPMSLNGLAAGLMSRYERSGSLSDLDEAMPLFKHALHLSHPERLQLLNNFAQALIAQFVHSREGARLDEAMALAVEALTLCPHRHELRATCLANVARIRRERFQFFGETADLDKSVLLREEVVLLHEEALDVQPQRLLDLSLSLHALANSLLQRFEVMHQPCDLERAVSDYEGALDLLPPVHEKRALLLNGLAGAVLVRFEQSPIRDDLDKAISLYNEALSLLPSDDRNHSLLLYGFAHCLRSQFKTFGQLADLERSILFFQKALHLPPSPNPGHPLLLHGLACARLSRFEHLGQHTDLEMAISLCNQALDLLSSNDHSRSRLLDSLSNELLSHFLDAIQPSDVQRTILLYKKALDILPLHHPTRSLLLLLYNDRFGQSADLDQAVPMLEEADTHSMSLCIRATSLHHRFKKSGRLEDLDQAILLHEQDLSLHPVGHSYRSMSLCGLANALWTRFDFSGSLLDLDKAILLHSEVLDLSSNRHRNRGVALNNLAGALTMRFQQLGNAIDVEKGVLLMKEVLALRPIGHPKRYFVLYNLASALCMRFMQSGKFNDIDEAVQMHEEALDIRAIDPASRCMSLNNLALALSQRYRVSKQPTDLNKAIMLNEEALSLFPPDHPQRFFSIINISDILCARSKSREHGDLDRAVYWCNEGLQTSLPTHPVRCRLYLWLGSIYSAKFKASDQQSDLNEALGAMSNAARFDFGLVRHRFIAANKWVKTASDFSHWRSAVEASGVVIKLLPQLVWLELDLQSRLDALSRSPNLVCDGAACAVRDLDPGAAVEFLDNGRGIFWAHALQLRTPFDDLPQDFAPELKRISHALQANAITDSSPILLSSPHISAQETVRRRQLHDEWLSTIQEIRHIPEFEDFLLPKPFGELARAADGGPVVILNASRLGCDAIILRSPHCPAEHVPLLDISLAKLVTLKERLDKAIREPSKSKQNRSFTIILEELWNFVTKPIIDCLGLKKSANPQRLWWCPTGPFVFLPIHAAGIFEGEETTDMFEYVVSSYTHTLDALTAARSRLPQSEIEKVLVVIQPEGHPPLPNTIKERKFIAEVVPEANLLGFDTALDGSDETVANVLSKLCDASIVHFACHGLQNAAEPLESALVLYDGNLTVSQMMHRELPNASIAFLSACHSAAGDRNQPDEMIHLAGALMTAGFRSVIATMWYMNDADGPLVAQEFYRELFGHSPPQSDARYSAHTLHTAVIKLRAKKPGFARWVPFIHMGV